MTARKSQDSDSFGLDAELISSLKDIAGLKANLEHAISTIDTVSQRFDKHCDNENDYKEKEAEAKADVQKRLVSIEATLNVIKYYGVLLGLIATYTAVNLINNVFHLVK